MSSRLPQKFLMFVVVSLLLISSITMSAPLNDDQLNSHWSDSSDTNLRDDLAMGGSDIYIVSDEIPLPTDYDHTRLASLADREIGFYGYADDDSIRNLVGYVDYVVIQHALYGGGAPIAANVEYLADHGVKVILVLGWWDVWPFPDTGVTSWRELDTQDVLYGMNATETVKYRIDGVFSNVDPADVWGVCISEEEPGPGPSGYNTPWAIPAYYMNYFYDWLKEAYPDFVVFQWPSPTEFITEQQEHGYYVKADGILYDNYHQDPEYVREIARLLKEQYPDGLLLFLTAAVADLGWGTPHPQSHTKDALYAVADYADMIGFFCYSDSNIEGWIDEFDQYFLALELCTQTRFHDMNTVYADTQWFQPLRSDFITESVDDWYRCAWHGWADDTKLQISTSAERIEGSFSVNLTQTDAGVGNYWYQPYSHEKYMGYDLDINVDDFNLTTARRISFWVKGAGWSDVTQPSVRLVLERQTDFYPDYYGNVTLPDITPWLMDDEWHQLSFMLPEDAEYNSWSSTACQVRVVSNYTGSMISNTTSLLLDGFDIQCFDDGVVQDLGFLTDYTKVTDGTLTVHDSAVYAHNITTTGPVFFSYSGFGSLEILANGSWYSGVGNNSVLYGVSGFRLFTGTWEWIKFNSFPSAVISQPSDSAVISDVVQIEAQTDDPCGIDQVSIFIDDIERSILTQYPFTYAWNTSHESDGIHTIKIIALSMSEEQSHTTTSVVIDNTAPVVSISNPVQDAEISETVIVSADVSDNHALARVEILLDDVCEVSLTSPPWQWSWDTTTTANGVHVLDVVAYDTMDHSSTTQIEVTVSNPTDSPPAPMVHQISDIDSDGIFTISWNMIPLDGQEILGYIVQMAHEDSFSTIVDDWIVNDTYLIVSGLDDESYYFRVCAQDYWGQLSVWSDSITVSVLLDSGTTTTILTMTSTETTTGTTTQTSVQQPPMTLLITIGGAAVIIVVIIIGVRRRFS